MSASWWLDVKLGLRMLGKQPMLTLVAIFALSIGIPSSLIPVHVLNALRATLPFDEGERIVGLRNWDVAESAPIVRPLYDFEVWRDELTSFLGIAAARSTPFNVMAEDGRAAPIRGSQISASAFDILRVRPQLGRALVEADQSLGATDVVVIGYDVWQSRLAGDPEVVGKVIRIGNVPHEVVGVMPQGFLFPVRDQLWLPLRARAIDYERLEGPDALIFGRLADGASLAEAQAELSTVGRRMADEYPDTHARLRPEVLPFSMLTAGMTLESDPDFFVGQLIVFMLLAVVCGNVGILILARTATRTGELAIRTAIGASRTRIVSQLFVESLVLAVVSAGVGLVIADFIGSRLQLFREAPFWFDLGVNPRTVLMALSVAVFCAVIAGVVPALKATGRKVQRNLQGANAGTSGIRFGGASTALIVAEVALALGLLTMSSALARGLLEDGDSRIGIQADQYLAAQLRVPRIEPTADQAATHMQAFRARVTAVQQALARRLSAEPGVRGFAMANALPGLDHPQNTVEVEGTVAGAQGGGFPVRTATVDIGFFDGLGQPIVSGRPFSTVDLAGNIGGERTSIIVNTTFVERVLGGRNPIGRRVRYTVPEGAEPGLWYEIIGVVGPLGMNEVNPLRDEGLYHPMGMGDVHPVQIAIHVGPDPASFIPRLREITRQIDPTALIQYPEPIDQAFSQEQRVADWGKLLLALLSLITVTLSAAGLYALMSFTVSERTREIGIRTALGAQPGNIMTAIARRAVFQLGLGLAMGVALSLWIISEIGDDAEVAPVDWPLMMALIAALMVLVGLAACIAPTLRGLRVSPVQALK